MKTTIPHASPALDELLVELDQVKKPRLFGINPGQFARGLRGNINPIGTREAGLSNLEELILEAHRDELARLLMDAARLRMREESLAGAAVNRWTQSASPVELNQHSRDYADSADLRSSAFLLRTASRYGSFSSMLENASASSLGIFSCRLLSTAHRRTALATILAFTGSPQSGLASLREVLRGTLSGFVHRWAIQNAAICAWRLSGPQTALKWIESVASSASAGPAPRTDYLSLALRAKNKESLAHAAALFEDSMDSNEQAFIDAVESGIKVLHSPGGQAEHQVREFALSQIDELPRLPRQFLTRTFLQESRVQDSEA